jgi:hypothetical protein
MNSNPESKLTGINTWFIIEILSFYGYLLSAIAFIVENSIKSSLGMLDKSHMQERYKSDFVDYHNKDLNWLAFVTILFNVNIGLICIDEFIVFKDADKDKLQFPLKSIVYQLLVNHLLQMIFLRDFYDKNRKVNTNHRWVWYFHIVSYSYIIYVYFLTDAREIDASESSKIWIPLDIILTFNIGLYQIFYNHVQYLEDQGIEETAEQMQPSFNEVNNGTPLLEGDTEAVGTLKKQLKKRYGSILFQKKQKVELDSIYNIVDPKVMNFKLTADSTAMGYAVFLKKEHLGLNLSAEQQSDVFMNSLIVQCVQVIMILCVWKYAYVNDEFVVRPAESLDMMVARFVASMMMHINVEKDVRGGINMMKYAVNHSENFNNVVPAFWIGLNSTIISLIVEVNVMIILSSMPNILGVVMKYVSLAAIANIPRFYYSSLVEHRMSSVNTVNLKVTKFRH